MINPLQESGISGSSSQATQAGSAESIQDQFMTMLMTQIQHQDPLNPMETAEFTSQLAQLSTVEQLQGVNKNLAYQQLYLASINNSQALGFIGHEVMASGNTVQWNGETSPQINYSLAGSASSVVVNIYDQNNTVVRTIHLGDQEQGQQEITWDGADSTGAPLPEGSYTFRVLASDADGDMIDSMTMLTGTVDGVEFEDGVTYVTVRGQKIPIGDIIEINRLEEPDEQPEEDDGGIIEDITDTVRGLGRAALRVTPFLL